MSDEQQSHQHARESGAHAPPPKPPSWRWFGIVAILVILVLAGGAFGHWRTNAAAEDTQKATNDEQPQVNTTAVKMLADPIKLTLPGQTQAFDQANIFARATGYVAERKVDIGSEVKQGQLLARIASPDLDRQLPQAEAQLAQVTAAVDQAKAQIDLAQANLRLGNATFARIGSLAEKGFETVQNKDNQQANVSTQQANVEAANAGLKVAEANVQAQQATVERLKTLIGFEEVSAPFDGIVSARNVDVGDLVNADSGGGTAMFSVVKDDVLRVAVNVPQTQAVGIRDGLEAKVHVFEMPDRSFEGRVARNAGALQTGSRTLPIQVDVKNPDHTLKAGIFVNVEIAVPREHPNMEIPADALIFNQQGLRVATVKDNEIHLVPVDVYRDLGQTVELASGLDQNQQVVLNPPTTIHEGQKVRINPPQDKNSDKNGGKSGGKKDGDNKEASNQN